MSHRIARATLVALAYIAMAGDVPAQDVGALSLADARAMARAVSPELAAAREGVAVARGLEIQAGAFANPSLSYSTERTSGGGQTNRERIVSLDQSVELGGQRGARREVARLRSEAAEARLTEAEVLLDFEVSRAYALAVAASRRASLAKEASGAFKEAARVSGRRLASGDISVYADRRLRLEAARYAALEAEAALALRSARVALSSLISSGADSIVLTRAILTDSLPPSRPGLPGSALQAAALTRRAELRAASLEADASAVEARLATRERIPTPVFSAGYKGEESTSAAESLSGFAAGLSLPLPLWDRRRGAIQAADASARRHAAEREAVRRRVLAEVVEAHEAVVAAEQQAALLAPQLGAESAAALRSAQFAYAEGEITLLEWLDAVRAYHEAESTYASLLTETMIRRAALERAIGTPLENVR